MADWTNLPNQAVGVGGLPSGTTVTALRDNPVAIAQGAAGAPRVANIALGGLIAGEGTASRSGSSGTSTVVTVTNLGSVSEVLLISNLISNLNATASIWFRTSTNNGSSWSSPIRLCAIPNITANTIQVGASRGLNISGAINAVQIQLIQAGSLGDSVGFGQVLITGAEA